MRNIREIGLRDGVTVSVKFSKYEHTKEYGSILIATWLGIYSECPSKELDGEPFFDHSSGKECNTRYIDGIMRASISIVEPRGIVIDVSQLVCYQAMIDETLFLGIYHPVTKEPLPLAVVMASSMMDAMTVEIDNIERYCVRSKLFFDDLDEALANVVPNTKRYGL